MISLRFVLKEVTIALNFMKFGMHYYLQSGHLNLRSKLSPINWPKVKLCRVLSLRLHLKGVKIAQNIAKIGVQVCLLKWVAKFTLKF